MIFPRPRVPRSTSVVGLLALLLVLALGCTTPSKGRSTGAPITTKNTGTVTTTGPDTTTSTTTGTKPGPAPTTSIPESSISPRRPEVGLDGPMMVTRVVDGDTIKVSTGLTLRLIGLDTPETVDPRKAVQCFGREASSRAHQLLDGAQVFLEYDPTQGRRDRYGRTLAYVWMADGGLFNERMIAEGFAHQYTYGLPYRYRDAFIAAERAARNQDRGLWAADTCAGDTSAPPGGAGLSGSGGLSGATGSGCDPAYPTVCIPPSPPDLDCGDVTFRRFAVPGPDPHRFDRDGNGVACQS